MSFPVFMDLFPSLPVSELCVLGAAGLMCSITLHTCVPPRRIPEPLPRAAVQEQSCSRKEVKGVFLVQSLWNSFHS